MGNVRICSFQLQSLDLPYGACKQSGIGREREIDGFLNEHSEIKSKQIDPGHTREQWFWYSPEYRADRLGGYLGFPHPCWDKIGLSGWSFTRDRRLKRREVRT